MCGLMIVQRMCACVRGLICKCTYGSVCMLVCIAMYVSVFFCVEMYGCIVLHLPKLSKWYRES